MNAWAATIIYSAFVSIVCSIPTSITKRSSDYGNIALTEPEARLFYNVLEKIDTTHLDMSFSDQRKELSSWLSR